MHLFEWISDVLRSAPELAIFLALAVGFWIGAIKFGSISLGSVTGTLLVGVLIGQLGIEISPQIKSIFFIMFLFAVGFGVGPQFVRGIASDGLPQALFAMVICITSLTSVYIAVVLAGYGPGSAIGLFAGSQTISASIGMGTDALSRSDLSPSEITEQLNAIPIAYAVTYLFGTIGTGLIITFLGPKLLRINLEEECQRYEREMSVGAPEGGIETAWHQYIVRSFRLTVPDVIAGKTVTQAEEMAGARVFLEQVRRDGKIIEFDDNTMLEVGDIVAVSGSHDVIVEWSNRAQEITDRELLDISIETVDVVVTSKKFNGRTLIDLSHEPFTRGVYINRIRRGSMNVEVPVQAQSKVYRGDIVSLTGSRKHIDALVAEIGYADRQTSTTDMVLVGSGIVIGGLIGSVVIPVGGIPITLSTSGGALIAGLIFGWLRSFTPKMGNVPTATVWFIKTLGLNIFIAVVGISAGPSFISGLREVGFEMFLWGLFATSVPMLLAPLIGKYIFRFDPAISLGCCCGARTSTASAAMVSEVAKSNVPMLGYTVPYAISSTVQTSWGMVIVLLTL
ncbi:aspartate-alanine antiporter [Brucellaceae bacterium C25G]